MGAVSFAFVLGTGRCGSTLVHEVLARHPLIAFLSNVDDNLAQLDLQGRWNSPIYRRLPADLTRKGRLRFAPSEGYQVLERQISPILTSPCRDLTAEDVTPWLATRFRRFFEERLRTQGAPVFLHKFTGWPRAGFIHAILPSARFLHVVRDGRAVANSFLQMPWWLGYRGPEAWQYGPMPETYAAEWERSGRSFVLLAGIAWKMLLDAFEAARERIPAEQWMDLRYEEFLADPRGVLERIFDFLGLRWTEAFETGFRKISLSTGRRAAYLEEIGSGQLELLQESLAGHLRRWSYEPAVAMEP